MVDRLRGCQQNGDSVSCAHCKDYPLVYCREAVTTARLPVFFVFCRDNRAEGLCVLLPHGYFTEESRESGVIFGCGLVGGCLTLKLLSSN